MNLDRLRIFQTVAKLGSFTGAAESLYMTQPAISKHIKALEEYYSAPLFLRTGNKVVLTPAGEKLLEFVDEILNLADRARTAMGEITTSARGTLQVGASMTVGVYFLPHILRQFRETFPDINVSVKIENSGLVVNEIAEGKLDMGLVGALVHSPKLVYLPFCSEELKLIVGIDHPWASDPPRTVEEIPKQLFLLRERGSGMRRVLEHRFKKHGLSLNTVMELSNTEMIIRLVETGMGVSIVSEYAVAREVRLGMIKALDLPFLDLKRYFYLVYNKERTPSDALKAIIYHMEHNLSADWEQDRTASRNAGTVRLA